MTYRTTVKNGVVSLPPDAQIEDGTEVEIVVRHRGATIGKLLEHAGTWHGDDADDIVDMIYHTRTSRHASQLK